VLRAMPRALRWVEKTSSEWKETGELGGADLRNVE
jgi:hypothetical protein